MTTTNAPPPAGGPRSRHLLLVHAGHDGGTTFRLRDAAIEGIREAGDGIELRVLPALVAGPSDLLWADGILLGTPEHFGYMAGALKDFFDRTFYPVEGRTEGRPYALFVSAGTDGSGTVNAVQRIVTGYRWRDVAPPLLVVGRLDGRALERARELGATLAAGLALGLF
jgi:hypothetical protein